ncbi:VanZ family protein [Brachybacterium huguangmaarense]
MPRPVDPDLRPVALVPVVLALVLNAGFYLPRVPGAEPVGLLVPMADKLVHVGVFALTVWAIGRVLAPRRRFPIGWVALGALAHAVLVEAIQGALLPGRSASPGDVVADAIGIALGVTAWWAERGRSAGVSGPAA